jgi:hypothetical protein
MCLVQWCITAKICHLELACVFNLCRREGCAWAICQSGHVRCIEADGSSTMHARPRPVGRRSDGHSTRIVHETRLRWRTGPTQLSLSGVWLRDHLYHGGRVTSGRDYWSVGKQAGADKDAVQEALFALRARIRRERQMRWRTDADVSGVRAIVSERLDERAPCAAVDGSHPIVAVSGPRVGGATRRCSVCGELRAEWSNCGPREPR